MPFPELRTWTVIYGRSLDNNRMNVVYTKIGGWKRASAQWIIHNNN